MLAIEVIAVLLGAPCLLLLAVAIRRRLLARAGGTIELSFRLAPADPGQGWINGVGRFASGGELRWYRVFSLSPRPRRVFLRRELEVTGRRAPAASEARALHGGSVVLECRSGSGPVELALDAVAVTGFLAWLESRPPGATLPR
ncbi:MAG: DUF2550 domain-containing protein [Frankiales bacterium]|nr:DUF2550 domain-containing protein [Frankiales bacterium]